MISALLLAALLQAPVSPAPVRVIAFDRPELAARGPELTVESSSFARGGAIPLQHSGYGRNLSPELHWSKGPAGTKSYVVIVEDPDAGEVRPLLHWLAYDVGEIVTTLPPKIRNRTRVEEPVMFSQGMNDHGGVGWTGPHPPVGGPAHHYHFQVFALDRRSVAAPGVSIEQALSGMRGHVLAKGQVMALYAQAADKPRKLKKGEAADAASPPEPPAS